LYHKKPFNFNKNYEKKKWKFPMYSRSENTFVEDLEFTKTEEENRPLPGITKFLKKEGEIYLHHRTYFGSGDNF
tara:strand:- start:2385 stop:2606 length:222 start_codon:yes stop_codon:yes gene_type:complete